MYMIETDVLEKNRKFNMVALPTILYNLPPILDYFYVRSLKVSTMDRHTMKLQTYFSTLFDIEYNNEGFCGNSMLTGQ